MKKVLLILVMLFPLGMLSNIIVINSNQGKMPVFCKTPNMVLEVLSSKRYTPLTDESRFPLLADQFYFPMGVFSVGDILILSGLGCFFLLLPILVFEK